MHDMKRVRKGMSAVDATGNDAAADQINDVADGVVRLIPVREQTGSSG